MATPKLNEAFTRAAKKLMDRKVIGPTVKHEWLVMRNVVWMVLVNEVFPELGIDPSKAATVPDPAKPGATKPNEVLEDIMNARAAFDKAFDDGYCLESSNCGKHLAAHGFVRSAEKEAAVAQQVFV